jgi:hypothetical protein
MKSLFPAKYHRYIYIFSLILLAIGLPLSKFLMSLSQIILICNWVLEGNLKNKFTLFFNNKVALLLSSVLIMHIVGMLYSTDIGYAYKDCRIKLPLLILPLVISSTPSISKKLFDSLLKLFVTAILLGTMISMLVLTDVIHRTVVDTRSISIFISHIRFALLICVAICVAAHFFIQQISWSGKFIWALIALWLICFLAIMESLTGLITLSIVALIVAIYYFTTSKNKVLKYGGLLFILTSLSVGVYYIHSIAKESNLHKTVNRNELLLYTAHGNLYEHEIESTVTENGNLIWINCCTKELEEAWNKRSEIKYGTNDLLGNNIEFTMIRFLAQLSETEIRAIERGVANVNYQNISSLSGRIHETLWEIDLYKTTGNANGHSLTQRFEYWKAALGIIKNNLFFGVGTGDVPAAFDQEYINNNSSLSKEWRLRAHNQYLSIAVAFGIIGLLWFLICLIYPLLYSNNRHNFLYVTFFIIAMISFLTEDTLETQAGVTFYAFLNSFLLFAYKYDEVTTNTSGSK